MSEVITIGSGTETILGTLAAAQAYVEMMPGTRYEAWDAASETAQQKTLVAAVRYLNGLVWSEDYDTFAEREADTDFHHAQYELAVLILEDTELTDEEQGSNIQSLKAGSAGITFFNPTTRTAAPLPPVLMRLVGSHLAASTTRGPAATSGVNGGCRNPMSDCSDNDRNEPW